jgi:hypothetical protein
MIRTVELVADDFNAEDAIADLLRDFENNVAGIVGNERQVD